MDRVWTTDIEDMGGGGTNVTYKAPNNKLLLLLGIRKHSRMMTSVWLGRVGAAGGDRREQTSDWKLCRWRQLPVGDVYSPGPPCHVVASDHSHWQQQQQYKVTMFTEQCRRNKTFFFKLRALHAYPSWEVNAPHCAGLLTRPSDRDDDVIQSKMTSLSCIFRQNNNNQHRAEEKSARPQLNELMPRTTSNDTAIDSSPRAHAAGVSPTRARHVFYTNYTTREKLTSYDFFKNTLACCRGGGVTYFENTRG